MDEQLQLLQEIKELYKHVKAGKVSNEDAAVREKILKRWDEANKEINKTGAFGHPNGGKAYRDYVGRKGLSDPTEALDSLPHEIENEIVICPLTKSKMTRGECLEYSGEESHYEECKDCNIGLANKKLLTPPIQEHI